MTKMLIPAHALVRAENTSIGPSIFYAKTYGGWIKTEVNKINKKIHIKIYKGKSEIHPFINKDIKWEMFYSTDCTINIFPKCICKSQIYRQINIINRLLANG